MELLTIVVLLAAALWLQNFIYRKMGLQKLTYHCYFNKTEALEGEEVVLVEELTNKKWLPLPWIKSEIVTSKWLDFAETQSVVTDQSRYVSSYFLLKGYHRISRSWKVTCGKRGIYALDKVVLVSSDLLGNVNLSKVVRISTELVVLPKPLDTHVGIEEMQRLSGDIVVKRGLIPDPFWLAGIREYRPGDSMRRIAWGPSAREDRLMVLENDSTTSQNLAVVLNLQSREFETERILDPAMAENCIRVCAALLEDLPPIPVCLLTNGLAGLITGQGVEIETAPSKHSDTEGISTPYGSGSEHINRLMYNLAQLGNETSESFSSLLRRCSSRLAATDILVISSFATVELQDFIMEKRSLGLGVKAVVLGDGEDKFGDLPGTLWLHMDAKEKPLQSEVENFE